MSTKRIRRRTRESIRRIRMRNRRVWTQRGPLYGEQNARNSKGHQGLQVRAPREFVCGLLELGLKVDFCMELQVRVSGEFARGLANSGLKVNFTMESKT